MCVFSCCCRYSNRESTETANKTINPVKVSDGGEYKCRAQRRGYYTDYSEPAVLTIYASADTRYDGLKPKRNGVIARLVVAVLIIVFLVLLWRYRNNKGGRSQSPSTVSQQQNNSQTSDLNQSEAEYNTLLSDSASESSEHMFAEIELESTMKQKEKKENKENETESSDCFYYKLILKTDEGSGSSGMTYVQVK
ncbi:Fc receptor 5 [Labeo rohita]|uniref:Fc receptor 5 n=1 Tax=Labeo rohita TaxID=84645 RepID=A0A498M1S8_LABRO|nr:Fc receptor 5 [Labeo rohita]